MFVLITGSLWRDPTARQSKAGTQFVTAMLKAGTQTETVWANVVAFDQAAQSELLRLQAGDALSVQGGSGGGGPNARRGCPRELCRRRRRGVGAAVDASGKVTIAKAPLPTTYVEAKQALAKCAKIDECASWADKALALASYGKQAGDKALENLAQKILDRAIARGGELLLELKASKGGRPSKTKADAGPSLPTRKRAAEEAGLSNRQAKDMIRVARVPPEQFEALVECDDPATVTHLAELGTKKRTKEPEDPVVNAHVDWRYAIKKLIENSRMWPCCSRCP